MANTARHRHNNGQAMRSRGTATTACQPKRSRDTATTKGSPGPPPDHSRQGSHNHGHRGQPRPRPLAATTCAHTPVVHTVALCQPPPPPVLSVSTAAATAASRCRQPPPPHAQHRHPPLRAAIESGRGSPGSGGSYRCRHEDGRHRRGSSGRPRPPLSTAEKGETPRCCLPCGPRGIPATCSGRGAAGEARDGWRQR
jgi:hypothetical protein